MTQEEIIEGNKLIAEFYGCIPMKMPIHISDGRNRLLSPTSSDGKTRTFFAYENELYFHSSWDWLMPVVEKIEKTHCIDNKTGNNFTPYVYIGWKHCQITKTQKYIGEEWVLVSRCSEVKIEAVWLAVVEFIKWYNGKDKS